MAYSHRKEHARSVAEAKQDATRERRVQKVLDVVKSVPLSEVFTSVEEADAYFDTMQRKMVAKVGAPSTPQPD